MLGLEARVTIAERDGKARQGVLSRATGVEGTDRILLPGAHRQVAETGERRRVLGVQRRLAAAVLLRRVVAFLRAREEELPRRQGFGAAEKLRQFVVKIVGEVAGVGEGIGVRAVVVEGVAEAVGVATAAASVPAKLTAVRLQCVHVGVDGASRDIALRGYDPSDDVCVECCGHAVGEAVKGGAEAR